MIHQIDQSQSNQVNDCNDLPGWLNKKEESKVQLSKGKLIQNNLNIFTNLIKALTKVSPAYAAKNSPWMRIAELIVLTTLILLSSQVVFLWLVFILILLHLVFLPGKVIVRIGKKLTKLILISLIVLLPSLLLRDNNIGLFIARTVLIMLNISIFLSVTSWPQFIQGLEQIHFPSVMILTLDITMKYVYTLGIYIQEVLNSIKLRTFGQHVNRKVLGVIVGQVYLSAKKRTIDLYQAMTLRGYNNKNVVNWKLGWNKYDNLSLIEILVAIIAYFVI
ncbi:energy-coupling factor transporter transmembrane component T [Lactobacillus sp. LL6]|uniref:energy-coupling factor transporter transmembrane component T family protein n=1 Tax=Lactobacillus sp. LL6 TaxID=2596827 RepID=UPI001186563F|nr:energy-coupling factor transporter transmembrane component T [Lactobacillus sp. LL6]TSO25916.1 cobalt transport protein [Lactobacillus sp. LL6]